jgi:oligoribonuclease (3'-5' exoribonuclease)
VADSTVLIIDTATSGFREATDTILEVACILVELRGATGEEPGISVVDTYTATVRQPADLPVPDFHKALLAECADPERSNSLGAVEGRLLAGQWTTADLVCNRNLDFDMRFLSKHMPTLAAALRKRPHIELKALERLATALGVPAAPAGERSYRAGDDAIAALEELTHYSTLLMAGALALSSEATQ